MATYVHYNLLNINKKSLNRRSYVQA